MSTKERIMTNEKTYRSEETKRNLTSRLNKIEGQIRGIRKMIESDQSCNDINIQVSAARSALDSFANELLGNFIQKNIKEDLLSGKEETVEKLLWALDRKSVV